MAYQFQRSEPIPDAVRRIAREELDSAAGVLSRARGPAARDEAIHEARKSLKKARALLRLMRPEVEKVYRAENPRLRDIALQLSEFRDAAVMVETFDRLGAGSLPLVRRAAVKRKRDAERQAAIAKVLREMASALREAAGRVAEWPLRKEGFAALAPGLEKAFRRGRKALARARKDARPENDHTWRKRVKDHWYHIRLLTGVGGEWIEDYEQRLKELETHLGECHNVEVLRERVLADPAYYGGEKQVAQLIPLIDRRAKELRRKALALGSRIYRQKPRLLVKRIERLWNAWQAGPARRARRTGPRRQSASAKLRRSL